jgi:3-dehydroquinate synthase
MGTGKTEVGREVARRLKRPFLDMDAEIEVQAGKPIPRIFAEDGEAEFRQMEAALCTELSARQGWVIATGGGALVDPDNRTMMLSSGTVVCLTCHVDEILQRLRASDESRRPLLDVANPRAEIERLLAARHEAYAAIPWQVDTSGLPVVEIARRVVALGDVVTLRVRHPGGEYPIHLGNGLLDHAGGAIRAVGTPEGSRIAVVSSPTVAPLYGAQIEASLQSAGFRPFACSVPDGEQHKTLATVAALYEQFLANRLDRSGTVLALGGGVTGDVTGFAAATFMRGVRFAQVPTTVLSMADASVGGKTGVDLPQGKNLVGAFKQPEVVLIDPTVLATLPEAEIRSGMVEVIKHGVISDPVLFAELESTAPNLQCPISTGQLARTLHVKIDVVEQDPFERGRRAVLNLGHTVGHGLERLSGFDLRHGEAVGIGMVAAARIAAELDRADPSLAERIETALATWGLPVRCPPFEPDAIWKAMTHDKKRQGRSLRWVLPRAIGQVEIREDVPRSIVEAVLRSMGAKSNDTESDGARSQQ